MVIKVCLGIHTWRREEEEARVCTGKQAGPITDMSQDEPKRLSTELINYWGWIVLGRNMTLSDL